MLLWCIITLTYQFLCIQSLRDVGKQTCMHSYYHHIFSVTDCGVTFNHIYNCQNRKEKVQRCHRKIYFVPSSYPSISADLKHGEEWGQRSTTDAAGATNWTFNSAKKIILVQPLTPLLAADFKLHNGSFLLAFLGKSSYEPCIHRARMFTLKTGVIKIEFYCVQVKDKNLKRRTEPSKGQKTERYALGVCSCT